MREVMIRWEKEGGSLTRCSSLSCNHPHAISPHVIPSRVKEGEKRRRDESQGSKAATFGRYGAVVSPVSFLVSSLSRQRGPISGGRHHTLRSVVHILLHCWHDSEPPA